MKRLDQTSKLLFAASFILFICINFVPSKLFATEETQNKKVKLCFCTNANNVITGYGNICVTGSGSCIANPCSGTQHCGEE